jgi:hypothetical protein
MMSLNHHLSVSIYLSSSTFFFEREEGRMEDNTSISGQIRHNTLILCNLDTSAKNAEKILL